MNRRGPRTSDVQRAKAAFLEASRALGEHATSKKIKAVSRLAKAAFRTEREALRRERAARLKPLPPVLEEPKEAAAGCTAGEFRSRTAGLSTIKGHAHFDAEKALRRELETAVVQTQAPIHAGASLDTLINVLAAEELLR